MSRAAPAAAVLYCRNARAVSYAHSCAAGRLGHAAASVASTISASPSSASSSASAAEPELRWRRSSTSNCHAGRHATVPRDGSPVRLTRPPHIAGAYAWHELRVRSHMRRQPAKSSSPRDNALRQHSESRGSEASATPASNRP